DYYCTVYIGSGILLF
nr:immunoglobulin light chain junction region [Macaca mulatta]MOX17914.1 immunoglobulin light chain junction region [Macaca mulatta]